MRTLTALKILALIELSPLIFMGRIALNSVIVNLMSKIYELLLHILLIMSIKANW
jgi:hypothetical protein